LSERAFELIVFDFDGTLVRIPIDYERAKRSLKGFFESNGVPIRSNLLITMLEEGVSEIGKGDAKTAELALKAAYGILGECEMEAADEAKEIQGARQVLDAVSGHGLRMALVTRNGSKMVHSVLERLGLKKYFEIIVTRDDVRKMKPEPDGLENVVGAAGVKKESMLSVGDHIYDIIAARRCGISAIGVSSEEATRRQFLENGATAVIRDIRDLTKAIGLDLN